MKKALGKWDEYNITILSELYFKMVILRHQIKMAWFDANCEDKPIQGLKNLEELTEEHHQKRLEERMYWRNVAIQRTDVLEGYIEKLATDSKVKELLRQPIYATRDNGTRWSGFILHSHIVFKLD
mmetsp:Transcript_32948/g.40751  ORF Transcript_32948/g.40751 Transcript_32948/m.40751 type:complete len:125 (-) Transcript_32948:183-557(-)|eukprot:CAMPEP_0170468338 /NCGR_PEP_ID=MMETSP0123-20130129/11558_1 /TAXON_ID=182087 /ORGANISM="Favella ehrenbergii, Strain Fehren 1" /LENGTH=124 /DNA_ID=CAMNT_0010734887 /DNA_START=2604 /DNA_END=2978 /DNA_ORIENTATION=-